MDLVDRVSDLMFIGTDAESGVPMGQRRRRAPAESGSV